jgi:hypothetical protein
VDEYTRRTVLGTSALAGAVALVAVTQAGAAAAAAADGKPRAAEPEQDPEARPNLPADPTVDRKRVLACGFTDAEADCWVAVNTACEKYFTLPKLHVMDDHELAHAFHVLQYRLMMRPAFRQYQANLEQEKKGREKK